MSVNSELKATKVIGQRKAFYRQRIPEFRCARKQTVDIDILVTFRRLLLVFSFKLISLSFYIQMTGL